MSKQLTQDQIISILSSLKSEIGKAVGETSAIDVKLTTAWIDNKQTIAIANPYNKENGIIFLSQDATEEEYESASAANLYIASQKDNEMTIEYTGEQPTCPIPLTIILFS